MTSTVTQAEEKAAAARKDVNQAEAEIASGNRRVTASTLHKIRDAWRHADLSAQGVREQAERERRAARLTGLEKIGAAVDQLAASTETADMADALRDVASAGARFRDLVAGHDTALTELVAAAREHGAEPTAPGGPRGTSAYVAIDHGTITYKRTQVRPVGDCSTALARAIDGDIDGALAELNVVSQQNEARRPDHLLRLPNGQVMAFSEPLQSGISAQLAAGQIQRLNSAQIDAYMRGELA